MPCRSRSVVVSFGYDICIAVWNSPPPVLHALTSCPVYFCILCKLLFTAADAYTDALTVRLNMTSQQLQALAAQSFKSLQSFERAFMILEDRDSQKIELQYVTERVYGPRDLTMSTKGRSDLTGGDHTGTLGSDTNSGSYSSSLQLEVLQQGIVPRRLVYIICVRCVCCGVWAVSFVAPAVEAWWWLLSVL